MIFSKIKIKRPLLIASLLRNYLILKDINNLFQSQYHKFLSMLRFKSIL